MKSKKERLSTIRTESEFLDEYFASRIIGKSVPEIRAMVRSGELKGRIWSNEEVSVDTKDAYLTSRTMADLLLVEEQDVLDWIKAGEIYAKKTSDGYRVPYKEYSRFGQSGAWMKKCHDKMFRQFVKEINDGEIISEVNEGFKRGMKPHIDKAREVVDYLEKIHSEYQSQINVLEDKTALVAAYVIHARIISLLHTTINLIENNELVGASTLFRSIYEGVDLSQYFILSAKDKNAEKKLRRWFIGGDVKNTTRTEFLKQFLERTGIADGKKFKRQKDQMYDIFSGFVHFSFSSIMESFNSFGSSGLGQNKMYQMGFDYKGAKLLRKSVTFLVIFEGTLNSVIATFLICFRNSLSLTQEQEAKLLAYREYFEKDIQARKRILAEDQK